MKNSFILGYDEKWNRCIAQLGVPKHILSPREQEICTVWAAECENAGTWGAVTRAARHLNITAGRVSQVIYHWEDAPEVATINVRQAKRKPYLRGCPVASTTLVQAYLRQVQDVGFRGALTTVAAKYGVSPQTLQYHIRGVWRPKLLSMSSPHIKGWAARVTLPPPHGEAWVYRHTSAFDGRPADWVVRWPQGSLSYFGTRAEARAAIAEKYMPTNPT